MRNFDELKNVLKHFADYERDVAKALEWTPDIYEDARAPDALAMVRDQRRTLERSIREVLQQAPAKLDLQVQYTHDGNFAVPYDRLGDCRNLEDLHERLGDMDASAVQALDVVASEVREPEASQIVDQIRTLVDNGARQASTLIGTAHDA